MGRPEGRPRRHAPPVCRAGSRCAARRPRTPAKPPCAHDGTPRTAGHLAVCLHRHVPVALAEVAQARRTPGLVVLEGFHAVKHALRFGAELLGAWTADPVELEALRTRL